MYRKLKRKLCGWLNRNYAPYVIVAIWDKGRATQKTSTHYAWSWDDAMDWCECYMPCDYISVNWRSVLGLGQCQEIAGRHGL